MKVNRIHWIEAHRAIVQKISEQFRGVWAVGGLCKTRESRLVSYVSPCFWWWTVARESVSHLLWYFPSTELVFSIVISATLRRVEWALRLWGCVLLYLRWCLGVSWQMSHPRQEAEDSSGDNICAVIAQHWTQCGTLSGLSEGDGSDNAAWAALRCFSPVVPSGERGEGCLGGARPMYGIAASRLCHCSRVLLLASPSRLRRGIKLRACSHTWPSCPENKFVWPWMVLSK